jgi:hypothetical protein
MHDANIFLYGFDLIELDGEDLRSALLEHRKSKLEKLLAQSDGIRFSEHLDGDGAIIFAHACKLGLEGIVSKRRDLPYRSGRCRVVGQGQEPGEPGRAAHRRWDVVRMSAIGEGKPRQRTRFDPKLPIGTQICCDAQHSPHVVGCDLGLRGHT